MMTSKFADVIAEHGCALRTELNPTPEGTVAVLVVGFDMKAKEWAFSSNVQAASLLHFLDKMKAHVIAQYEGISAASRALEEPPS